MRQNLETALQASTLQYCRTGQALEQRRVAALDDVAINALTKEGGTQLSTAAQGAEESMYTGGIEMGNTYHVQQPVPPQPAKSELSKLAGYAMLAFAATAAPAAVAWKYLDRPPAPVQQFEDKDSHLELRILE
jgi:hypothetical protein